jgi:hypothetical protein
MFACQENQREFISRRLLLLAHLNRLGIVFRQNSKAAPILGDSPLFLTFLEIAHGHNERKALGTRIWSFSSFLQIASNRGGMGAHSMGTHIENIAGSTRDRASNPEHAIFALRSTTGKGPRHTASPSLCQQNTVRAETQANQGWKKRSQFNSRFWTLM